jgi:hypothetical protein
MGHLLSRARPEWDREDPQSVHSGRILVLLDLYGEYSYAIRRGGKLQHTLSCEGGI